MNTKSTIIGQIYLHQELCEVCGKVGQSYEQKVYINHTLPEVSFDRANIPVGWYSTNKGVYCSENCFRQEN